MGLSREALQNGAGCPVREDRYLRAHEGVPCFALEPGDVLTAATWLRGSHQPGYVQLCSITATDESLPEESEPEHTALRKGAAKRFRVVYHLAAILAGGMRETVRLVTWVDEGEPVPSVTSLWKGANWLEREVYDMFGIPFDGHPDLKRILMPDGYDGHPLRKEFPLRGTAPDRLYREWDRQRQI